MESLNCQKLIISGQQSVRTSGKATPDSQPRDTDITIVLSYYALVDAHQTYRLSDLWATTAHAIPNPWIAPPTPPHATLFT